MRWWVDTSPTPLKRLSQFLYDPLTAMFFSPDPFIHAPENWLNYNRYGYCMNNPTRYTDLSGYQWDILDMPREDVAWVNHADPASGPSGISSGLYGVYGSFGAFDVGSGGYSGGFTSWYQIGVVFSNLLGHSDFGGTSYGPNQTSYFKSDAEAYIAGFIYQQHFGDSQQYFGDSHDKNLGLYGKVKAGSKIINFKGFKGLTLTQYEGYNDGRGYKAGLAFNFTYTGDGDGYYFAQYITTNFPDPRRFLNHNKTLSYWDDYDTANQRYLTEKERIELTDGNTITYRDTADRPNSDDPWFFSAKLYLFNSQNQVVLKIYWGFSVVGNDVTPYPLIVK